MGYGLTDDSSLERWGMKRTRISGGSPVYMFVRLNGADSVSSVYFTVTDGVPYLLTECAGWGLQYDIDGDGAVETAANAGASASPDYMLYEWDFAAGFIRHVRLAEALQCDSVTYLNDRNLFYAFSSDTDAGTAGLSAVYQYKAGKLIEVTEADAG